MGSFAVLYSVYELNRRDVVARLWAHWSSTESPALSNLTLCATAVFSKLAASSDDVVWLMPFLCGSTRNKIKHSIVYVGMFMLETCACTMVTQVLAMLVDLILPEEAAKKGWTLSHVMQAASGSLLCMYAIKLFVEQWNEDSDEASQNEQEGTPETQDVESEEPTHDSGDSVKRLVVIGILGSLDDMCIQSSLIMAGTFQMWHMLLGVFIGCCIVVAVCWGASSCGFILRFVEKVPLWAIVAAMTLYTFLSVFLGW